MLFSFLFSKIFSDFFKLWYIIVDLYQVGIPHVQMIKGLVS